MKENCKAQISEVLITGTYVNSFQQARMHLKGANRNVSQSNSKESTKLPLYDVKLSLHK